MKKNSVDVAKASIDLSISTRKGEVVLIDELKDKDIKGAAVDIGGNLISSVPKIIERALVASKRTGLIKDTHHHDGAVAGATREAIMQVSTKANGLNVGGKIGIARSGDHLSVCIFLSIGLLHLNEVVIGIGHRTIGG